MKTVQTHTGLEFRSKGAHPFLGALLWGKCKFVFEPCRGHTVYVAEYNPPKTMM